MLIELIHPPHINSTDDRLDPPLGLLLISTHLREIFPDIQIKINDLSGRNIINDESIGNADIYGITTYATSFETTKDIVKICRNKNPNCKITVGGAHPSALPETFPFVDHVVIGEGEDAMMKIIKGTSERFVKSDKLVSPELLPSFELIDTKSYHRRIEGEYCLPMLTSRGCCFRCDFCLPGKTKILTSDLKWINIKNIKIGDKVIGVKENPTAAYTRRFRYENGEVLKTFKRRAMVYGIETENGTVYCTEEHPWLMRGKWSSIKDIESNIKYNASFTSSRSLLHKISEPQKALRNSIPYMKGYIAGSFAGDGHIRHRKYSWEAGIVGDYEMLDRVLLFSKKLNLSFRMVKFNGGKIYKCNRKVVTYRGHDVRKVKKWRDSDPDNKEFIRGFLSGVYDAEGTYGSSGGALRFCNEDDILKNKIIKYLSVFNFRSKSSKKYVMLFGGLSENIRFLSLCQPYVTNKKQGWIGKSTHGSSARIKRVYQVGKMDVYNISTTIETYIADGFVSHNCGLHKMHEFGRAVRLGSPEIVAKNVEKVCNDFSVKAIGFQDDIFTLNHNRLFKLLEYLKPLRIKFRCMGKAGYDEEKVYEKLAEAGCVQIAWGIESASQKILDKMNKKSTVQDNYNVIKWAKKYGITSRAFFIIGFPGETEDTLKETMEFIEKADPDQYFVSNFIPYPGCSVWNNPKKYGIIDMSKDFNQYYQVSKDGTGGITISTEWLTKERFRELEIEFRKWISKRQMRGSLLDYEKRK